MSKTTLQLRRGSTSDNQAFTGALGEVVVDTTLKTLVVHDGATVGGNTLAPLASPAFTGTPTAPTPTTSTSIANKAYVDNSIAAGLPSISVSTSAASGNGSLSYSNGVFTFTPANLSGYSPSITSSSVTTALGYTPYNGSTNPNGYLTSANIVGSISVAASTPSGALTYNNTNGQFTFVAPVQSVNGLTGPVSLTTDNIPSTATNAYLNLTNLSSTLATGAVAGATISGASGATISGDFSNSTVNNRTVFKTTTTNSSTGIYAIPNGTNTAASWQAANSSNLTNASKILIATNGTTDVQLVSGVNGSGTYLPLTIYNNGAEQVRVTPTGFTGFGNANPQYKVDVAGDINLTGALRTGGSAGVNGQILQTTGTTATWASISSSLPNITELDNIASTITAQAATAQITGNTMSVTGGMAFGNFITGMNITNNALPTTLVQSGNQVQTTTFTASVSGNVMTVTSIPTNFGISIGMAITGSTLPAGVTIVSNTSGTGNSLNSTWTLSQGGLTVTSTTLVATNGSTTFTGTISGNQLLVQTSPTGIGIYPGMVLTGGAIPQAGNTNQVTVSTTVNFVGTTTMTYVSGTLPTVGMLISGVNVPLGTYVVSQSGTQGTTLQNVAITGTAGQFSCTSTLSQGMSLQVGQPIVFSGTAANSYPTAGTIQGYSSPTTYYISATNGSTTFTLTTTIPNAFAGTNVLVTATGTPTGLTAIANPTYIVSNPVTSSPSLAITGITYTQGYNVSVLSNNNGATGTNAVINASTMQVLGSTTGTYAGNLSSAIFTLAGVSVSTAGTYYNVTQSSTSGGGGGAVFNITKTGSGTSYSGATTITVVNPGSGYQVGDTIKILGTQLGGSTPAQDMTMTVALVTGFTTGMVLSGTGVTFGTTITTVNAAQFYATLNGTTTITVTQYSGSTLSTVAYGSATTLTFTSTGSVLPVGTAITVQGSPITGTLTINGQALVAGQTYYAGAPLTSTSMTLYATYSNALTSTSPLSIVAGTGTTGATFSYAGNTFGTISQNMVVTGVGIPNGTYIVSGVGPTYTLSQPVYAGTNILVTGLSYNVTPIQTVTSTTISGAQTGSGSSWTISASPTNPSTQTLSSVSIVGTAGQFTCAATTYPLVVGLSVTLSGTFGGSGLITSPAYATGTTYYIIATNGYTSFTLSAIKGGSAITTTVGTPSGITYVVNGAVITGGLATVSFIPQLTVPYSVGSTVIVSGVTPVGYNGTYTVLAATTSSVSYANPTSGLQTGAGSVGANIALGTTILGINNASMTNATINNGGSGAGNILTVGAVTSGTLSAGMVLNGGTTTLGTLIVNQLTSSSAATATTNIYSTTGTYISGGASGTNSFVTQISPTSICDVGNYVVGTGIPAGTQVLGVNNSSVAVITPTAGTTNATTLGSVSLIDNAGTFSCASTSLTVGQSVNIAGTNTNTSTNTITGVGIFNNSGVFTCTSNTLYNNTAVTITGTNSNSTAQSLTGVSITGVQGTFNCTAATLQVGQTLTITGNATNTPTTLSGVTINSSIGGFSCTATTLYPNQQVQISGTMTSPITLLGTQATNTTGQFSVANTLQSANNTALQIGQTVVVSGSSSNLTLASGTVVSNGMGQFTSGLQLSGVTVAGTTGQFTCSSTTLVVGQPVVFSGSMSGLSGIGAVTTAAGPVANGTPLYISATNGSTTFTLTTSLSNALNGINYLITTTGNVNTALASVAYASATTISFTSTTTAIAVGTPITISGASITGTMTINGSLIAAGQVYYVGAPVNATSATLYATYNNAINGTGALIVTNGTTTGATFTAGATFVLGQNMLVGQSVTLSGTFGAATTLAGTTTFSNTTGGLTLGTATNVGAIQVGSLINITGTQNPSGTIVGYTNTSTNYIVTGTNGSTTLTLASPTGLPLTLSGSTLPYQVNGLSAGQYGTLTATNTSGAFSLGTPQPAGTFTVGQLVNITGTASPSNTISGYPAQAQYIITATNGTSTFTIGTLTGGTVTTVAQAVTGLIINLVPFAAYPNVVAMSTTGTALASVAYASATTISFTSTFTPIPAGTPVYITGGAAMTINNVPLLTGQVYYVGYGTGGPSATACSLYSTAINAINNVSPLAISNASTSGATFTFNTVPVGTAVTISGASITGNMTIGGTAIAAGQVYYMGNITPTSFQLFPTYQNAIGNTSPLAVPASFTTTGATFTTNAPNPITTVAQAVTGLTFTVVPSINGYTTPTTYYISSTNGATTFMLTDTLANALNGNPKLITGVGTTSGVTFTVNSSSITNGTYYIVATDRQSFFTLSSSAGGTPIATTIGNTYSQTFTLSSIVGYANTTTTYYIAWTNGINLFTLAATPNNYVPITTVASTPTGLTFTLIPIYVANYYSGNVYYITSTNGSTSFTLSTVPNGPAINTVIGTPTGLTYSISAPSITGYTTGTTYYITTTNGTNQFILSSVPGGPSVTTTAGVPSGLTFTVQAPSITGYSAPSTYYIVSTNGVNTFQISATSGGTPVVTVPGIPAGLTLTTYTATLTFASTASAPFPTGGYISIAGFSAQTGFNGYWPVLSCNTTSVTYPVYTPVALTATTLGTITGPTNLYGTVTLSNNLTTQAAGSYTFYDGGVQGSNSFGITTAAGVAIGQIITGTGIPSGTTITGIVNQINSTGVGSGVGVVLSNPLTTQATGTYSVYTVGGAGTYTVSGTAQLVASTAMAGQSYTVTPSQTVAGTTLDGSTASINGGNTQFTPTNNSTSVSITNPVQVLLVKNGVRLTGWLNKSRPMWNTITKYGDYTVNSSGQIVFTSPPQVGDIVQSTVLVGNSTNPIVANYPFNAVDIVTGT